MNNTFILKKTNVVELEVEVKPRIVQSSVVTTITDIKNVQNPDIKTGTKFKIKIPNKNVTYRLITQVFDLTLFPNKATISYNVFIDGKKSTIPLNDIGLSLNPNIPIEFIATFAFIFL